MVVEVVNSARGASTPALSETATEFGDAAGVALLGSAGITVYRRGLDPADLSAADAQTARDNIGGAVEVARAVGGRADQMLGSAQVVFVDSVYLAAAFDDFPAVRHYGAGVENAGG